LQKLKTKIKTESIKKRQSKGTFRNVKPNNVRVVKKETKGKKEKKKSDSTSEYKLKNASLE